MGSFWAGASGLAAVAGACVAYGVAIERRWYRLRHLRVAGALHGPTARPVRILHLSDLHFDPRQGHKQRFVSSLRGEGADLVVLTGDLLGGVGSEDPTVDLLAELTEGATPGVAVLGSNDRYGPRPKNPARYFVEPGAHRCGPRLDTELLVSRLAQAGYRLVQSDAVTVDTAAGPVAVGGLPDPHLPDTRLPPPEAIRPAGEARAYVGLVHAPYRTALDLLVGAGYEVLFAGHTHGGQVRFPPLGALVGNCDLPLDQIRGLSRYGPAWLHVSPGLGTSRYAPFRFACRPEATLLELT